MFTTTISSKGQIVIPTKLRKSLKLEKGTVLKIHIKQHNNQIILEPAPNPGEFLAGILVGKGGSAIEFKRRMRKEEEVREKRLNRLLHKK